MSATSDGGALLPKTVRDPGASRFWIAVILTGVVAGGGAAALTLVLHAVLSVVWGVDEPSALMGAVRAASAWRHVAAMFGAGLLVASGQWALTRLESGSVEVTAAIWFSDGRVPLLRTVGSAFLSVTGVAIGVSLGREGGPKQLGAVAANLFASWRSLDEEERRLLVAIGAGAGMAAVYSVPLGGALFALEALRGFLALRFVLPAIAASIVATLVASAIVPNAPIYPIPAFALPPSLFVWTLFAAPLIGLWAVGFVRAIAWADRHRPEGSRRFVITALTFGAIGALSVVYPEVLGNGQNVADEVFRGEPIAVFALAFLRPLSSVACFASGAPGGLFTPSLAAGALAGAALGAIWSAVLPGAEPGAFALIGAGAMLAATTQGPISTLVLMMELTGHARDLAPPMILAVALATLTSRAVEWRSVYEARLDDKEVAERRRERAA